MSLVPTEVWSLIFNYLREIYLIEVSAVCKEWNGIVQTKTFISKLRETHKIHFDRDWLLKPYKKFFDRFCNDMYWEMIYWLSIEKLDVLEDEVYNRMFYSVLPFRVWSHLWKCYRSQFDPNVCQFCTKLQIKDKKVTKKINKKLTFDARKMFPANLYYGVISNGAISLFVHVEFVPDRQRPCSKNNYGVLYYEVISSLLLFKTYLDILGKIILSSATNIFCQLCLSTNTLRSVGDLDDDMRVDHSDVTTSTRK